MSRILVTGVGGAAGIAAVSYLKKAGHYVLGVNCLPYSAGFQYSDDWAVVPYACDEAYIDIVLDLCLKHDIHIMIPTVDEELLVLSEKRALFHEKGVTVLTSSRDTLECSLDKYKFYEKLSEHKISVAKTWRLDEIPEFTSEEFPLIAKPATGRGGRGVIVVHNMEELRSIDAGTVEYIVQEYAQGIEYSVDTLSDMNGKAIAAVPRKRLEVKGGVCWRGVTDDNQAIIEESKKAVEAVGLVGPGCLQLIYTKSGEIKIFELNPRIGGTVALSINAGVDIVALAVDVAEGKEINNSFSLKKMFISRYFEDAFFEIEACEKEES